MILITRKLSDIFDQTFESTPAELFSGEIGVLTWTSFTDDLLG